MTRLPANDLEPQKAIGIFYESALELVASPYRRPSHRSTATGPLIDSSPLSVAAYRGRARLRRYVVENMLDHFLTLTTSASTTIFALEAEMRRILRSIRRKSGKFPFAWVLEGRHARPHLHVMTRRPQGGTILDMWRLGHSDQREVGSIEQMRKVARYMAKEFHEPPLLSHRYYLARSFTPQPVRIEANSVEEVIAIASSRFGEEPAQITAGRGRLSPAVAFWDRGDSV